MQCRVERVNAAYPNLSSFLERSSSFLRSCVVSSVSWVCTSLRFLCISTSSSDCRITLVCSSSTRLRVPFGPPPAPPPPTPLNIMTVPFHFMLVSTYVMSCYLDPSVRRASYFCRHKGNHVRWSSARGLEGRQRGAWPHLVQLIVLVLKPGDLLAHCTELLLKLPICHMHAPHNIFTLYANLRDKLIKA